MFGTNMDLDVYVSTNHRKQYSIIKQNYQGIKLLKFVEFKLWV